MTGAATQLAARLTGARRVVIKIGSALLVDRAAGQLRAHWLAGLAQDVARMRARGQEVVIVSSGAIALGRHLLGLSKGALALEQAQAAAAVGQIHLAGAYQSALAAHGLTAAQMLVTLEDSEDRRRYLNARATLQSLLSLGAVPVVNENDTIATDEIRYGDNDRLAAQVAVLAGADLCVLLSDVDGLYTAPPGAPGAVHLPLVEEIDAKIEAMAGGAASETSRGGMRTKVLAARAATAAGTALVIGRGDPEQPLAVLEAGAKATLFPARATPAAARKAWINGMKPRGTLRVDAGAAAALRRGGSLLPAGLRRVEGQFGRGDPVEIRAETGDLIARGLTRYTAEEARAIAGVRSEQISAILGHEQRAALVHRDDMIL